MKGPGQGPCSTGDPIAGLLSPLATRADIVRYRDTLTAVRYLVRAEIQANKTEDQAVADKPLAPIGKILGSTQQVDDNMVRIVYRSFKNTPANPA
jgi:hypothetical protein